MGIVVQHRKPCAIAVFFFEVEGRFGAFAQPGREAPAAPAEAPGQQLTLPHAEQRSELIPTAEECCSFAQTPVVAGISETTASALGNRCSWKRSRPMRSGDRGIGSSAADHECRTALAHAGDRAELTRTLAELRGRCCG